MNEVAALRPASAMQAMQPQTEESAVLHMIERAARDPSVDIDKLERLLDRRDRLEAQANKRAWDDAMSAAQAEMGRVSADCANPQTRSKYASYAALDRAIRPIYVKHGFSLCFDTADGAPAGEVRVVCDVSCSGHTHRFHIDMPADGKGAKGGDVMTKTHATGSAASYGRRYLLLMIFNIAVGDDDGNAAGAATVTNTIRPHDVERIQTLIVETGSDIPKFLATFSVNAIEEMDGRTAARAISLLEQKKTAQEKRAKTNADH